MQRTRRDPASLVQKSIHRGCEKLRQVDIYGNSGHGLIEKESGKESKKRTSHKGRLELGCWVLLSGVSLRQLVELD